MLGFTVRLRTVLVIVALVASVASWFRARWILENRACLQERAAFHTREEAAARRRLANTERELAQVLRTEKKPEVVTAEVDSMLTKYLNDPFAYANLLKWLGVTPGSQETTRAKIVRMWTDDIISQFNGRVSALKQQEEFETELADYHGRLKQKYEQALAAPWRSVEPDGAPPQPPTSSRPLRFD